MNKIWMLAHKLEKMGGVFGPLVWIFERISWVLYGNHIPASISIGDGTVFEHHGLGCVIHEKTVIGKNCRIFQNVTIGAKWPANKGIDGVPIIEDNVRIGCGAAILGPIHIGANSVIGANAVVVIDVPPNAIAVGVPASIKEKKR